MEKSFYEQVLINRNKGSGEGEHKWDKRAEDYNLSQEKDGSGLPAKVTAILQERGILSGASILDIGGGSGRYAVPFAAKAQHVTVTDISANMLEFAQRNAQREGLTNLSYVKLNWSDADLSALGWRKKFDLSFASMCPAIRSPEGLAKMLEASRGFCLINQFISGSDTLADYLNKKLGANRHYDPHNDRETVQAIFNLLWLEGYEPEITYLRQEETLTYSVKAAYERYAGKYAEMAQNQGMELEPLIAQYAAGEDVFPVSSKTTLAMILWAVCC